MDKVKETLARLHLWLSHCNGSLVFFVSVILIIPFLVSLGYWSIIKCIPGLEKIIQFFSELFKRHPNLLTFFQNPNSKFVSILLFIISLFIIFFRFIYHPKAYCLSHSSLNDINLSPVEPRLTNTYNLKYYNINLFDEICNGKLKSGIKIQSRILTKLKQEKKRYQCLFYYGIAHIPFVFLAGYLIGDESTHVKTLHKNVDNDYFISLPEVNSNSKNYPYHKVSINDSETSLCKELIVTIETSFDITASDIKSSFPNHKNILTFSYDDSKALGRDSLNSHHLQKIWCEKFWNTLRNCCKENDFNKVHLLISSSTDFTFYLAQHYSKTYDVDMIVYHYDRSEKIRYPWGINIKKKCICYN